MTVRRPDLFREEALRYRTGSRNEGDVLRLPPAWMRAAVPLVLLIAFAGALFLWMAPVREFATGPAVVRFEGPLDLRAPRGFVVTLVRAIPGNEVAAGAILVAGSSTAGRVEIRAPGDGIVREVGTAPGATVVAGDVLVSLATASHVAATAYLPARAAARLKEGQSLRLFTGSARQAAATFRIGRVGAQVLSPDEVARRAPGVERPDEPSVPVYAEATGSAADPVLRDGSIGRAEAELSTVRLLEALVPALRSRAGS